MNKRYREDLDKVVCSPQGEQPPECFTWRGREYLVLQVLGHWREDPGWWRNADGARIQIEQSDLWRVEARNGVPTRGVYEIARRGSNWRLEKVWD